MLAVHMAAAGTALAVPLWTPEARAQVPAEQSRRYAIPAGPLTAALNRFAEESGVLLSAPGDLSQGKAGPGLSGEFTVAQGFAGLLAGSGLVAVRTGDNRYTLQQVSADGAMTLDPVTVEGSADALARLSGAGDVRLRVATIHGAYDYLLREFGLEVAAVVEPAHGIEPSPAQLAETIETLRKLDVQVIFSELNFPSAYVETIRRETGIRLYAFSHISHGEYAADLFEREMKRNLDTLVQAMLEARG